MIEANEVGTVWCFMNEVLEDSIRQLVICLAGLSTWPLGTCLRGKHAWKESWTDCTACRMNWKVEKPRWKERVGCFQHVYSLCIERPEPLAVLFSGPGRLSYSFSHSSHTNHELDWPPLAKINPTPLHESWPSTKSSSPGKEL
jgi:hypothetical protein